MDREETGDLGESFPLYEILTGQPPAFDEDGMTVYFAAGNPGIAVEKLTHLSRQIFSPPVEAELFS